MSRSFLDRARSFAYKYRLPLGILASILLFSVFLFLYYLPVIKAIFKSSENLGTSFINLTRPPQDILKNQNDRTNILLLGMGGAEHEAGDLTDSMTLISYHFPTRSITLVSLPRDLWVDSLKAKINTAYYYGERKQPGG